MGLISLYPQYFFYCLYIYQSFDYKKHITKVQYISGQVMKYKVKQTSFLNWSWQRASARIILLTTQTKEEPSVILSTLQSNDCYHICMSCSFQRFIISLFMTWYTILHYEAISELWNTMYFSLQLAGI